MDINEDRREGCGFSITGAFTGKGKVSALQYQQNLKLKGTEVLIEGTVEKTSKNILMFRFMFYQVV